jgi:ABC-2 type transport system ATP-binding protein
VLGVLQPDAGEVRIEGIDVAQRRKAALLRTNFAAVYATLPGNLTVQENLRVFGMIYGVRGLTARIEAVLRQFELERFRHTRCGLLSSGEQTRVGVAKALLNRPGLLLLDEPTASLDPATAQQVRSHMREIATRERCGILWTSHNMYEVETVCDRVLFMSRGRILLEGDPRVLPGQHGAANLEELFIDIARERLTEAAGAAA